MRRYLVVANQTIGGGHQVSLLRGARGEAFDVFLLVPASPPGDHLWTEAEAKAFARRRLEIALERFRKLGIEVTGEGGDGKPLQGIDDVLSRESFDEIRRDRPVDAPTAAFAIAEARPRASRRVRLRAAGPPRDRAPRTIEV